MSGRKPRSLLHYLSLHGLETPKGDPTQGDQELRPGAVAGYRALVDGSGKRASRVSVHDVCGKSAEQYLQR